MRSRRAVAGIHVLFGYLGWRDLKADTHRRSCPWTVSDRGCSVGAPGAHCSGRHSRASATPWASWPACGCDLIAPKYLLPDSTKICEESRRTSNVQCSRPLLYISKDWTSLLSQMRSRFSQKVLRHYSFAWAAVSDSWNSFVEVPVVLRCA